MKKYISELSPEENANAEALLNKFQQYWNKKDSTKMVTLFTQNAEFTDIMGQVAIGKEKIDEMHKKVFGRFMKHAKLEQQILYMREITSETALVTCKWKTSGHSNEKNDPLPDRQGLMQVIIRKVTDNWLISLVHNLDFTVLYNNIDSYQIQFFTK